MALIKCPECGKDVSDSCERCIHCGYSINKCPECGTLVSKDETVCSNCGKNLQEKAPEAPKENSVEPKIDLEGKDSFTVWENLNPEKKQKRKSFKTCQKIVDILLPIVIVIVLVLSSTELRENGLLGVVNIKGLMNIGAICAGLVWFTISIFNDLREHYTITEFSRWCYDNDIDTTKDLIKSELDINSYNRDSNLAFTYAIYYKRDKESLNRYKKEMVINLIISLITSILLGLIVRDNFIQISSMLAKLVEFKFKNFYWDDGKIALLVLTMITSIVVGLIFDNTSEHKKYVKELIRKAKEEQKSENSENK